ncbi:MAG: hypothetical protein HDT15_08590 [Oscillibacter sp.]|nr:hypothetical protein [Oscillibacter sp.]MBD5170023.1 hypothetical protein [Oscillibacter sp.]
MADVILSFVLSILEGGLSGAIFYYAGQEKDKKCKVLMYIASAAWFILSVLDGVEGARALKAAGREKAGEDEAPEFWNPDEITD